ncbi:MAG: hypothetical protein RLZZ450_327 [Pseudomonadota bacterium]
MKTFWMVAKHIPDLRRRETINIGVLLVAGDQRLCRFVGQRPDGTIDGRRVRSAYGALPTYKAWVAYWQAKANEAPIEELQALTGAMRADDSFFLEPGGTRLLGDVSPGAFLDTLFAMLVEPVSEPAAPTFAQLTESVFDRLSIGDRVQRKIRLEVPTEERDETFDTIVFDYRYDNGRINLFQAVSLSTSDDRSWTAVHAAAWSFDQSRRWAGSARGVQPIALIRPRERDDELTKQINVLRAKSRVIDVSDESLAVDSLGELLHLH